MDKQNTVCLHNEIFSHKKEAGIYEPCEQYTK